MRSTVVPAQITTVEDKVIGRLSVPQLVLLTIPVAVAGFVFAALPIRMAITLYKIPIVVLVGIFFGSLAFRFRGKLIVDWLIIIFRYNLRPRYYVFNKNTNYLRIKDINPLLELDTAQSVKKAPVRAKSVQTNIASFTQLLAKKEQLLKKNVSFVIKDDKKGEAYVVVK